MEDAVGDRASLRRTVVQILGTEPAEEEISHYLEVIVAMWPEPVAEAHKEAERGARTPAEEMWLGVHVAGLKRAPVPARVARRACGQACGC